MNGCSLLEQGTDWGSGTVEDEDGMVCCVLW